jgi:hypothetical protein
VGIAIIEPSHLYEGEFTDQSFKFGKRHGLPGKEIPKDVTCLYLHLALEHRKGRLKFLQVGVAPDGEAGDFPRRSIFGWHRRSFKNELSDDQGNLWKWCHLQKACLKRRTELKE